MANWQMKLQLGDVYHVEQLIPKLAGIVAKRLKALKLPRGLDDFDVDKRNDLVGDFQSLAEDPTSNVEDFDAIMAELYDWADTPLDDHWNGRKLCWVDIDAKPAVSA